ncbi:MAG TPA: MotA/TolQ/ExbB proton channel family protein [Hyphomicrobium sp.]|nr:MotA/TolQ/ExbB proton channel family protein [Hyphomicrobium sp.]
METAPAIEGRDFSIIGLIMHADPFVQGIMLLLAIASVICWALIFEKFIRIMVLKRQTRQLARQAEAGQLSPNRGRGIVGAVQHAAQGEWADGIARGETRNELRGRLERSMRAAMKRQLRRAEGGLPFLATVGSASPFIGLLGTVWGIMHSFTAIAQAKDTSLAVVAPGIAEALFATALGLAAAIPAVVAYNQITVALGKVSERSNTAIASLAKSMARNQSEGGVVRLEGVG